MSSPSSEDNESTSLDNINPSKLFECVFVKNGEEAKLRVVKTGIQDDSNIQITEGLKEGETVIIGPYNVVTKTLKSGDKVEVAGSTNSEG